MVGPFMCFAWCKLATLGYRKSITRSTCLLFDVALDSHWLLSRTSRCFARRLRLGRRPTCSRSWFDRLFLVPYLLRFHWCTRPSKRQTVINNRRTQDRLNNSKTKLAFAALFTAGSSTVETRTWHDCNVQDTKEEQTHLNFHSRAVRAMHLTDT